MQEPWYNDGLVFGCTKCGKCCTGAPGYVWLTDEEVEVICKYLCISQEEFLRVYTRRVNGKLALVERKQNFDCIFLKNKKCLIYAVRPKQCKTYPFWKEIVQDKASWKLQAQFCEGINHPEGKLHSVQEIASLS